MTNSLIGFHCGQGPTGIGQLTDAGAALVMSVDDAGVLIEAEQKRPGIPKVMRFFVPDIAAESGRNADPVAWAHWYVAQFQPKIDANKAILQNKTCWLCGPNEPVYKHDDGSTDREGLKWLVAMEAERIKIMAGQGIQCAVFNFSTGWPPIADLDLLAPIIPVMKQFNTLCAIHGYSAIDMSLDNDNTNRHEMIHAVWPDLKIVYTEWGANYPWNIPGLTEDLYTQWFIHGDARLRQASSYLVGVASYLLGGTAAWEKFRLNVGMVNKLAAYLKSQTEDATPPASPPVVVPPPVVITPAPLPSMANLLTNPDLFSQGFHVMPGHFSTNIGNGWQFHAEEGIGPDFPDSPHATPWGVPSAVYHSIDGRPGTSILPASEHALYFNPSNPVVWHAFLPFGKQWWKLSQTIKNLPAGTYQFHGEIYPDIYTGAHRFAGDPACGQWWVSVETEATKPHWQGNFGKWNNLARVINHPGGDLTVTLEAVAPFGVEVVGWFVRGLGLFKVEAPVPTPTPTPAAFKVGDSVIVTTTELNVREQAGPDKARKGSVLGGMKGEVIGAPVVVADGGTWIWAAWWDRRFTGWVNASPKFIAHG